MDLPYNWSPRTYQEPLYDHFPKEYIPDDADAETRVELEELNKGKFNRAYLIKTRRYGFDLQALNIMVKESQKRVGVYYHIFPTYAQGKKDLWNNRTKDGIPFLDYVPKEIIEGTPNKSEMIINFKNKSIYQVVGSDNYDCYDEKTEILTKDGWKYFKDIGNNEVIATLNDGYLIYEKINCKMEYDYNGEMYKVKSGSIDLLTTPNHKYYVKSRKGIYKFKEIKNKTILGDSIPATVKWKGKDIKYFEVPEIKKGFFDRCKHKNLKFNMKDWCAFMGIYLSEGSTYKGKKGTYQISIAQSQDVNTQTVKDIKLLLKRMGLNYYYSGTVFQILNKQLYMYLKKFGKCYKKFIPRDLLELSIQYLRILKDWLMKGDGHICKYNNNSKDYETYQTTSKKLIDSFQELVIKLGYSGNIRERRQKSSGKIKGREIKTKRVLYSLGIKKSKYKYFKKTSQNYITKENYKGKIYCVDVNSHIIKVRRNGFEAWCGNSLRGAGVVGVIFSEWAFQDPNCLSVISPMISETEGWMIFGTTPNGKNHGHRDYLMAKANPDFYCELRKVDDTKYYVEDTKGNMIERRAVSEKAIESERARGMSETEIQREYYCFPPEAPVLTKDGLKEISKIEIGDIVLTHTGRWRAVKNSIEREYEGKMIRIKTYGIYEDILCTPEHPIRIYNRAEQTYQWVKAKDIKGCKGKRNSHKRFDQVVFSRLKSNSPIISKALVKLIGWYITEGSVIKTAVQFSLNKNEDNYVSEIVNSANELGLSVSVHRLPTSKMVQLKNSQFADFLVCHCGKGAKNKKIPLQMINGNERILFDVLMKGDGCETKDGWAYSTISKTLAYQVQILSTTVGYGSGITHNNKEGKGIILGREVNLNDSYNVQIRNVKRPSKIRPACHGLAATVINTSLEEYDGFVYNLNVEFDNSYIAYGRMVHNCSFEAPIEGAYYEDELALARKQGRITGVRPQATTPVYTFWDLGYNYTSIWFAQFIGREIHLVNYYENCRKGLTFYVNYIKDWRDKNMVTLGKTVLPHDAESHQIQTGTSIRKDLENMGFDCKIVKRPTKKEDGHEICRQVFGQCWWDEVECENGLSGLSSYHSEYIDAKQTFAPNRVHDWASHPADAFQTLAFYVKKYPEKDDYARVMTLAGRTGRRRKYKNPENAWQR